MVTSKNALWVLYLTMTVAMITPFGNDLYIASLPSMGHVFHTEKAQLVVSIFLLGLGISQLFYGPLLDKFGRKPVLITGLFIFTAGTIAILESHSIDAILWGRFFQGVGACSTITSALAMVRDSFPKEKTISIIAIIMGMIAICPTLAPMLGGVLQTHFGWQGSFIFLLLMGIFYLFIAAILFKETMKEKNKSATKPKQILTNYKTIIQHRQYLGYILTSCFSYSVLFAYISIAPFIIMVTLQEPPALFGVLFSLSGLGIITMNFIAPKLTRIYGMPRVLTTGTIFITVGSIVLFLVNQSGHLNVVSLVITMLIISSGIGIIRPTASAGAMNIFPPKIAGSASAMFGFFSFSGGGIASMIVSDYIHGNVLLFSSMILILGLLGFSSSLMCRKKT